MKKIIAFILVIACIFSMTACFDEGNPNDPGNNNNNENPTNEKYSKYSQILQDILNSNIYSDIFEAKQNNTISSDARFDPHPFTFLESEGYDIAKIKSGETECYTMSYILYEDEPNNLYISTRVMNEGGYYTNYLLTYQLTDQEISDYKTAHGSSKYNI